MNAYYADLHIHIGRTEEGQAVKISAADNLTFYNIAREASEIKGMDIVGIIDCHSPGVQKDMLSYLDRGRWRSWPAAESAITGQPFSQAAKSRSATKGWEPPICWLIFPASGRCRSLPDGSAGT
ncbi:endonuclease Q family protein [Paenibacillus sp. P26]|nr:endonuclease Q family protein [Paenibacillus sp. P26]